jgi:capsule polysaccharide modification protein KpsS
LMFPLDFAHNSFFKQDIHHRAPEGRHRFLFWFSSSTKTTSLI